MTEHCPPIGTTTSHARRLRVSLLSLLGGLPVACGGTTTGPEHSTPTYVGVDSDGQVLCGESTQSPAGLVSCEEGYTHRPATSSCAPLPGAPADAAPANPCASDDDCEASKACLCGPFGGSCYDAACRTDADCLPGEVCVPLYAPPQPCQLFVEYTGLACARPVLGGGGSSGRAPSPTGGGTCGRPFLVHDEARVAPYKSSTAWTRGQARPALGHLTSHERTRLAAHWARMGQLEHASIAAFARFSLQLLSLGAPPELIAGCTRALADETAHAQLCFEIAGAYAGHPVGPGLLDVTGSLAATSLTEVVDLVIIEGCIGETSAALEALEAAEVAEDPVIAAAYARIAADEERHAQLAFQFVRWAFELEPLAVSQRLQAARRSAALQYSRARDVVVPCFDALLAQRVSSA